MKTIDEEPVLANFDFHPKKGPQPKGYKSLRIEDEVIVTTKGKVKQIGSSWQTGAKFSIEVSSCEIESLEKNPVSLDDAVANSAKMRKRVM